MCLCFACSKREFDEELTAELMPSPPEFFHALWRDAARAKARIIASSSTTAGSGRACRGDELDVLGEGSEIRKQEKRTSMRSKNCRQSRNAHAWVTMNNAMDEKQLDEFEEDSFSVAQHVAHPRAHP